jgi:hypothetical protein
VSGEWCFVKRRAAEADALSGRVAFGGVPRDYSRAERAAREGSRGSARESALEQEGENIMT